VAPSPLPCFPCLCLPCSVSGVRLRTSRRRGRCTPTGVALSRTGTTQMRDLLHRVHGRERNRAAGLWPDALRPLHRRPQWFHGDVSTNNLLVRDAALAAVLDFGCSSVGDPACDTVLLWTRLPGHARKAYREGLGLDDATWARGRRWAFWKALIMITNKPPGQAFDGWRHGPPRDAWWCVGRSLGLSRRWRPQRCRVLLRTASAHQDGDDSGMWRCSTCRLPSGRRRRSSRQSRRKDAAADGRVLS
jgi:Phosphotransferase enzyme family